MQEHVIELNNRYLLKIHPNGFVFYELERAGDGTWRRGKAQQCKNFEAVIETIRRLELMNEDVQCIEDILKVQQAILSEIKELKAMAATCH